MIYDLIYDHVERYFSQGFDGTQLLEVELRGKENVSDLVRHKISLFTGLGYNQ